jgi:hypothetical protein
MSANRKESFRPQLEGLEDRCTPSATHGVVKHAPPPRPVAHNTSPPYIFNPFQVNPPGITVRNLLNVGHTTTPSDGGFFPQGLGTNFFPPSIFHF